MPEPSTRKPFGVDSDDSVLLDQIRGFVADAADLPVEEVGPDDDLYTVLKIDSLGAISIFVDLAHHYGAPEPREVAEYQALNTSRKLLAYVRNPKTSVPVPPTPSESIALKSVAELLPYGLAFRFVDEIVTHERGQIATRTAWSAENPLLQAHFPSGPRIVPGALLGEQFVQSALLLGMMEGRATVFEPMLVSRLRSVFLTPASIPVVTECRVVFRAEIRGQLGFAGSCLIGMNEIARFDGLASRFAR